MIGMGPCDLHFMNSLVNLMNLDVFGVHCRLLWLRFVVHLCCSDRDCRLLKWVLTSQIHVLGVFVRCRRHAETSAGFVGVHWRHLFA